MASTVSAANLKVKITEEVILNGKDQGGTTELTISSIGEISKRIITITTTESTIATFSAATASAGHYIAADVRYIRFTNKDDTNFITLTFRNQDNDEVALKLDAGQSFIWCVIMPTVCPLFLMQLKMLMLLLIQLSEV